MIENFNYFMAFNSETRQVFAIVKSLEEQKAWQRVEDYPLGADSQLKINQKKYEQYLQLFPDAEDKLIYINFNDDIFEVKEKEKDK